jgi:LacI family transcriptional regulator
MERTSRVKITDVASRAGVSATTVSHVLNDVPGKRITSETRERVREAAEQLGYTPNGVARSLRTQRSQMIALVSDEIATTPFASNIILGAQEAAAELDWLLVVANTGTNADLEAAEIGSLRQRQVDGFLYARMYHQEVQVPTSLRGAPVVLLDARTSDPSFSSVVPDEYAGGLLATRELVAAGHRRIGFLVDTADNAATRGRLAGYRTALEEAGIGFRPELAVVRTGNADGGYAGGTFLLSLPEPPTGIFCFNDRLAMGCYFAAHELGLRIPADLSVVGFDNHAHIADGLRPGLTTVALPHYEMGAWAVRALIRLIQDPGAAPVQEAMTCTLIRRGSVALLQTT